MNWESFNRDQATELGHFDAPFFTSVELQALLSALRQEVWIPVSSFF